MNKKEIKKGKNKPILNTQRENNQKENKNQIKLTEKKKVKSGIPTLKITKGIYKTKTEANFNRVNININQNSEQKINISYK